LVVDEQNWRRHVAQVTERVEGLVPVVKGNGYGFGRSWLADTAAEFAREVAVGTVHEAAARPGRPAATLDALTVLTPAIELPASLPPDMVLTVGHPAHVDVLRRRGWRGRVYVKLASSMQRYGVAPDHLDALVSDVHDAGLTVHGFMLHPPLVDGHHTEIDNIAEITTWIDRLDPRVPLSLSHVSIESYALLQHTHPQRSLRLRMGTALWHGDRSFLQLRADVLDIREVIGPTRGGYRQLRIVDNSTLVMIGAGTAHGVTLLPDGRSPFHHQRHRLTLLEPPHMHTSMALLDRRACAPRIGDWVDVQRPLITTTVDEIVWE
jgi:alanine racemase